MSNLWREKEDLTEVLSPFASCYFRECYSLEVKGKSVASASHLLDPDPFHTPSGWRGCLLSELATGSLYVVEIFNGGFLVFSDDWMFLL